MDEKRSPPKCEACPDGSVSAAGSSACIECGVGQFQSSNDCKACAVSPSTQRRSHPPSCSVCVLAAESQFLANEALYETIPS